MPEFEVTAIETSRHRITLEANDWEEAEEKAKDILFEDWDSATYEMCEYDCEEVK